MCTAATYTTKDFYFGRNLDLEFSYQESVTVTPRNFPIPFRTKETLTHHYALIGMAFVCSGFPLYYDATNEFGLSMAGLNFLGGFIGGPRNPDGTPATQDSNGGYGQMPGGVDSTGSSLINAGGSMLAGIGDAAGVSTMAPPAANDMVMTGGGSGPTFDMRGSQLGV